MELNKLRPAFGSTGSTKRIGRGQGSGRGGTSTKGHKGAKSRSGFKNKRAFEGGQMPLQMRLPKIGFKNFNRVSYVAVNVSRLQEISEKFGITEISMETLTKAGIVSKNDNVKILGNGDLKAKLTVKIANLSSTASEKIVAAGGSVIAQ